MELTLLRTLNIHQEIVYIVEWEVTRPLRFNFLGKHWPPTTVCKIYGFWNKRKELISQSTVTKDSRDEDNPNLARLTTLSKALKNSTLHRTDRKEIWKEFHRIFTIK